MERLEQTSSALHELFEFELHNAKSVAEDKIKKFCDVFAFDSEIEIYTTEMNYIVLDKEVYEMLKPIVKSKDIIAKVQSTDLYMIILKKHGSNILNEYLG